MARQARLVVPFQVHHVIQRGNDRQQIFRDSEDYRRFLDWLGDAARLFNIAIHAYVLMPDHIHLLLMPSDEQSLGRMMQWVGRYYVPYFNHKYGRVGTLWQGRFKASVIDSERYFVTCCRYIELNPVRAGIVEQAIEYPWSSYAHQIGVKPDPLITDHSLYWALGNTPFEREAAYREMAEQVLTNAELKLINDAVLKGWILGLEDFQRLLEAQTKRRMSQAKRGRPPKKVPGIEIA